MARNIPLRHELKFFINEMRQLDRVLWRDPNGDVNNEYHIRSLYFDTIFNDAYFDKMDGDQNRDKYRIRIYNMRDTNIKLECKTKVGSLISKRSLGIPRDLAEQIIDYVREAYLHPAEEVRITFDKQLRSGMNSIDLFNPAVATVPPFDNNDIILEVKYNQVMPPYIRDLLNYYCPNALSSAISKYTWCRRFEAMEI